MAASLVVTVILNTNKREDTLACLESLRASTYAHHRTVVLDNHSTDGSIEAIASSYPEVRIVPLQDNCGYAGNNNVGIEVALADGADWIFVLNEDTILAPDCIAQLVAAGEQIDRVGIVGPMVYHADEPTVIQSAGGWLDQRWRAGHLSENEEDRRQWPDTHAVAWVSGCALMIRRAAVEHIGVLDERFFYYWEETEWCLRAGRMGWQIRQVPSARLWHKGVKRDYRPGPAVTYYSTRNKLLLMQKHHAPVRAWVDTGIQLARTLVSWTVRPKWKDRREHRDAMLGGLRDFASSRWGMRPPPRPRAATSPRR